MQNLPGVGVPTFRKLADAGVNVDLLLPVRLSDELFLAVICVDNVDAAGAVLGDLASTTEAIGGLNALTPGGPCQTGGLALNLTAG